MISHVVQLEVESAFLAAGRGYVIARLLAPEQAVELTSDATLHGFPVERWLEVPRALGDADGSRRGIYAFCLRSSAGLEKFSAGMTVLLRS